MKKKTYYRTCTVDGVEIFYREAGSPDDPVVLLLHGWPSSSRMFEKLIPTLSDRYHVIAPDYPAFGHSDTPDRKAFAYTFDNFAEVIDHLIEKVGLRKYTMYVHDFGAPVGYRIALKHPDRVTGLIVQNAPAPYANEAGPFWKPVFPYWKDGSAEHREQLRAALFTLEGIKGTYLAGAHDQTAIDPDNWVVDYALMDRPGVKDIMLDMFYGIRKDHEIFPDIRKFFKDWQPPTLITHGRNDPIFTTDGAKEHLTDLPNAELHLLETGHFALEECGDEIADLIGDFLDRNLRGRHLVGAAAAVIDSNSERKP
jgi:pimeloyl-ACP methyl ester carboxylesterase